MCLQHNRNGSQLCINTSIVYMHRFYMFHSFKQFHRNTMAPCFIFLGAKVEEQPRKLEHVLKVAHRCLHKDSDVQLDIQSDEYMQMAQDLVDNESILLQTLGFDLSVEHPHTYVVKCAQMVKAAKELAQTSYFLATNCLHLTTFCIEEKPTVVACVCIFVACKWMSYEIPETQDKKHWWEFMDSNTTIEKIEEMSSSFIKILDSCPTRLKKKISTGPVIYKGGSLLPKRDSESEGSRADKQTDANANKTFDKIDGKSSTHVSSLEKPSDTSARKHDHSVDGKRDHADSVKRPSKHSSQSDHDRKNTEHHKHHKHHKHSDREHGKRLHDRNKTVDDSQEKKAGQKRSELSNAERSSSDGKQSSTSNRSVDNSKSKTSSKEDISAEAKFILSLPPLHHKHSLPEVDKSSSTSETPAKKQRVEDPSHKKQKLESDASKSSSHTSSGLNMSSSSNSSSNTVHKKMKSSSEKHKNKPPSEKHSEAYRHQQQMSEKSSHGQKHHTNFPDKHSKERAMKYEQSKSASTRGTEGSEKLHSRIKIENTSSPYKSGDEISKKDPSLASQSSKHLQAPFKASSSERKAQKSTPKKNGHTQKTNTKSGSLSDDSLLPPPPPPPSVEVSSLLSSPPPLPFGPPETENKQAPAPPSTVEYEQNSSLPLTYSVPQVQQSVVNQGGLVAGQVIQGQNQLPQSTSLQSQGQQALFPLQHQVLQQQQAAGMASQGYQGGQAQFLTNAQSTASSSTYGIPQVYFQGQPDGQTVSSDSSRVYGQTINTANLFSSNMGLLAQPPRPPQGLVLQHVMGLPPPPPLNLPPFPPP
ncbi:cyclin-T1-like isoform X2 [Rhopilema esculentum]|uniref:cyclin-T1-like isoform X2 n=1 Tax=Rhopilema esculentum TaxID=499914 RepID=UPI0031DE839E